MGTQLIGSSACMIVNPAKSPDVGAGVRVNTLTLACDQPQNSAHYAHQTIFHVGDLIRSLCAVSVEDDHRVQQMAVGAEIIDAAECRIAEAGSRVASTLP